MVKLGSCSNTNESPVIMEQDTDNNISKADRAAVIDVMFSSDFCEANNRIK